MLFPQVLRPQIMIAASLSRGLLRNKISWPKACQKKKNINGRETVRFALDPAQVTDYLRPTLAE
jgi:hypothetical protein